MSVHIFLLVHTSVEIIKGFEGELWTYNAFPALPPPAPCKMASQKRLISCPVARPKTHRLLLCLPIVVLMQIIRTFELTPRGVAPGDEGKESKDKETSFSSTLWAPCCGSDYRLCVRKASKSRMLHVYALTVSRLHIYTVTLDLHQLIGRRYKLVISSAHALQHQQQKSK